MRTSVCVCVCVCVYARVCVRVCVCANSGFADESAVSWDLQVFTKCCVCLRRVCVLVYVCLRVRVRVSVCLCVRIHVIVPVCLNSGGKASLCTWGRAWSVRACVCVRSGPTTAATLFDRTRTLVGLRLMPGRTQSESLGHGAQRKFMRLFWPISEHCSRRLHNL